MPSDADFSALDVIVVGAGIVGLTAAVALHKAGFKVLVVDAKDDEFLSWPETFPNIAERSADLTSYDNRVSALTRASENIFKNLSVWDSIVSMRACAYTNMSVWDGEGTGAIAFSSADIYQESLGHIVENCVTVAALLKAIASLKIPLLNHCIVQQMHEPSTEGRALECLCTNEAGESISRTLRAKLIVGADGAMSKIRQLSAIPLWQWDYGHHAIVASVKTEKAHQRTARQSFTRDGPLAFLPLADPYTSSIVYSTSPAHAKSLMEMDDKDFSQALSRTLEYRLGDIIQVSKRAVYPLRQRHAKSYVLSGLALIGDAGHTIHPLAGQGVNLGLLDVAVLVEVLTAAKSRRQSIAELAVLQKYQRQRHNQNLKMSAAMQAFKWLFDPQPAAVTIARNWGMSLLNKVAPVKQHVITQAMGLSKDMPMLAKVSES